MTMPSQKPSIGWSVVFAILAVTMSSHTAAIPKVSPPLPPFSIRSTEKVKSCLQTLLENAEDPMSALIDVIAAQEPSAINELADLLGSKRNACAFLSPFRDQRCGLLPA
jgi:hypothetical protein